MSLAAKVDIGDLVVIAFSRCFCLGNESQVESDKIWGWLHIPVSWYLIGVG